MQQLESFPHPECQITLFRWNNKYIVKFEQDMLEQTYKVSEMDITGINDVYALINNPLFVTGVLQRFIDMRNNLMQAIF